MQPEEKSNGGNESQHFYVNTLYLCLLSHCFKLSNEYHNNKIYKPLRKKCLCKCGVYAGLGGILGMLRSYFE